MNSNRISGCMALTTLSIVLICAACFHAIKAPKLVPTPDGAELSTTETVELDSDEAASEYAKDLMNAIGYEEPNIESEEKIRDRWITLMTWTAIGALVALCAWYVTKLREIGGVAMILGGSSIACGGLAATADKFWIVGIATIAFIALIVVGFVIKDKSLFEFAKKKLEDRRKKNVAE